jgi:phosphopantothenoylcysteine decarboxylase/phosphopantothenate--cysteine ligase
MHFLITAGATREYIDPVRFISNASSGRMGYALARAALKAGHKVTLITTVHRPSSIEPRVTSDERRATIIVVETAAQMFKAVQRYFPQCDCLIMNAAVADYTPARKSKVKIKKAKKDLIIRLKPTTDILKWAGKHKNESRVTSHRPRIIVGFALEDKNLRQNAEKKLKEKNLDMIIANTPAAIGADKISVLIKTPDRKWLKIPKANKTTVARKIVFLIEKNR